MDLFYSFSGHGMRIWDIVHEISNGDRGLSAVNGLVDGTYRSARVRYVNG